MPTVNVNVCRNGVLGVKVDNHRYLKFPGDDLTGEPQEVIDAAEEHWTAEVIDAYRALTAPPTLSVDETKAAKLGEIGARFSAAMAAIKAGYPADEVTSWDKQEQEARAYTADPAAPVPLLSALATARSITVADLAARVIEKADLFAQSAGALIGKRQALEDQLNAIVADASLTDDEKRAAIAAVVW